MKNLVGLGAFSALSFLANSEDANAQNPQYPINNKAFIAENLTTTNPQSTNLPITSALYSEKASNSVGFQMPDKQNEDNEDKLNYKFGIEVGGWMRYIRAKRDNYQSIAAIIELIKLAGGDPDKVFHKYISAFGISPTIQLVVSLQKGDYFATAGIGTSLDYKNLLKIDRTVAIANKNIPISESFAVNLEFGRDFPLKNELGTIAVSVGAEYFKMSSGTFFDHSNLQPTVIGLLNQLGKSFTVDKMNFLLGTKFKKDFSKRFNADLALNIGYAGKVPTFRFGIESSYYLAGNNLKSPKKNKEHPTKIGKYNK